MAHRRRIKRGGEVDANRVIEQVCVNEEGKETTAPSLGYLPKQ